jgi:two-component system sensor histidine kinase BaeS
MNIINKHISVKLFVSYLIILMVGVSVLLGAVIFTAPGAYSRHMQMNSGGMNFNPRTQEMMGDGIIPGKGMPGQGIGFNNFRDGILEALGYSVVAAIFVAVSVSVIFSRQIVAPLKAMMAASQRISDGRYDERVTVKGADELAQLGERFNKMAERLEQTESMRRQLIGDVSHELRTPLTAIGGFMEGLIDGVLPESPETYEQVRTEAKRLSRLVDDLQELSRVESGSYRLDIHPVNIVDIILVVAKRLNFQFTEKNVRLKIPNYSAEHVEFPPVSADIDRITQVLTNLIANALIYTPTGGQVSIFANQFGPQLKVSVVDNGIGISSENIKHIFDRFFRVDKSRSRAGGGGSGIGLTIAKAIVEAHGGRLWVESDGEEMGSSFIFTLPIAKI